MAYLLTPFRAFGCAFGTTIAPEPSNPLHRGRNRTLSWEMPMNRLTAARPDSDEFLGVESAHPATLPGLVWPPNANKKSAAPRGKSRAAQGAGARKWLTALAVLLLVVGAWEFGQGFYIQAKAQVAQLLIRSAWTRTLTGERQVKPWPWADTWPVARLQLAGRNVDLFVLAGADGRAMAFGPGHMFGTALPGERGNSVIGGHRDTHLAFLRDVPTGSMLSVQRPDGALRWYRVKSSQVLDKNEIWVTRQDGPTRLTLVTCYPFDALRAGGEQRYVVFANAVERSTDTAPIAAPKRKPS
jgi:sortase A